MNKTLEITKLETFLFRYPLSTPVQTSFGTMNDRPLLLVRVTDADGYQGWGEVWCNFPTVGAEHRKRLIDQNISPLLLNKPFDGPQAAYIFLNEQLEILIIQSAEPGPFAQAIAGVDTAMWDLAARREDMPLWKFLGGNNPKISVYASGLNPTNPERLAEQKLEEGFQAFKLKIGFGDQKDRENLTKLRSVLGDDVLIMADANQGWDLSSAKTAAKSLEDFNLYWLEEPIKVTRPPHEWSELADSTSISLAGGENMMGQEQFLLAIDSGALKVIQPDLAKWGGFTDCLPLAKKIIQAGLLYCPHYLGGGIGLLASAHLLAAVGGDGKLEIDANDNPLRNRLCGPLNDIDNGSATLSDEPGLGVALELNDDLNQYLVN